MDVGLNKTLTTCGNNEFISVTQAVKKIYVKQVNLAFQKVKSDIYCGFQQPPACPPGARCLSETYCLYDGEEHKAGETWSVKLEDPQCKKWCTCQQSGEVTCRGIC